MQPKDGVLDLDIADIDVGGDIHRIILNGGLPGLCNRPGENAGHMRARIETEYDELRRLLITPPYGNEDMCVDFVFDSEHAEAAFGYVIMECMGYPYYSGSNTMATVAALLEYGYIPMKNGEDTVRLEAPGGVVKARYQIEGSRICHITVDGGAAYVMAGAEKAAVPGYGTINYALVWSGAYYVLTDAAALGLAIDTAHIPQMKRCGQALLDTIAANFAHEHPQLGKIAAPGFVHFMGSCAQTGPRSYTGYGATYGYPDTVFSCPTGTGTSARMALMALNGQIEYDAVFENISAMGSAFIGTGLGHIRQGPYEALASEITAQPFVLSSTRMHIDFENPRMHQFVRLKDILA